jgi:hypothetical protein
MMRFGGDTNEKVVSNNACYGVVASTWAGVGDADFC